MNDADRCDRPWEECDDVLASAKRAIKEREAARAAFDDARRVIAKAADDLEHLRGRGEVAEDLRAFLDQRRDGGGQ